MAVVAEALNEAQKGIVNNESLVQSMDLHEVDVAEVMQRLKGAMKVHKKDGKIDNALRFAALLIVRADDGSGACTNHALQVLAHWSRATSRAVRQRSCQLVSLIFSECIASHNQAEIDPGLVDDAMLERLSDRTTSVRSAAARSVSTLLDEEDDECAGGADDRDTEGGGAMGGVSAALNSLISTEPSSDVRQAALFSLSERPAQIGTLIERLNDCCKQVRYTAVHAILNGNEAGMFSSMTPEQRSLVLYKGLSDPCDIVRDATGKLLCRWFFACDSNATQLVRKLDVHGAHGINPARMALFALMHIGSIFDPIKLAHEASTANDGFRKCTGCGIQADMTSVALSFEEAIVWRAVLDRLSSDAKEDGTSAAQSCGFGADEAAKSADRSNTALEAATPDNAEDMFALVEASLVAEDVDTMVELLRACQHLDTKDSWVQREMRLHITGLMCRSNDADKLAPPIAELLMQCSNTSTDSVETARQIASQINHSNAAATIIASTLEQIDRGSPACVKDLEPILQQCHADNPTFVKAAALLCLRSQEARQWAVQKVAKCMNKATFRTETRAQAALALGDLIVCFGRELVTSCLNETSLSPIEMLWSVLKEDADTEKSIEEAALSAMARLVIAGRLEADDASSAVCKLLSQACKDDIGDQQEQRMVQACTKALEAIAVCKREVLCYGMQIAIKWSTDVSTLASAVATLLQRSPANALEAEERALEFVLHRIQCQGITKSQEASLAKLAASMPLQFELSSTARSMVSLASQAAVSTAGRRSLAQLSQRLGEADTTSTAESMKADGKVSQGYDDTG